MVAVNKAVINLERKKLVTKSLQTEIIYSLSPSTNVSEVFIIKSLNSCLAS